MCRHSLINFVDVIQYTRVLYLQEVQPIKDLPESGFFFCLKIMIWRTAQQRHTLTINILLQIYFPSATFYMIIHEIKNLEFTKFINKIRK